MDFKKVLRDGKARLLQGLLAGIIGAIAACFFFFPGWMDNWEAKTWDWRVNMLAKPTFATPKIRLILLDQNSLDWGKNENGLSWPWPREVYGTIIQFCKRTGTRSLAFDVLFTEPSKYGVADDQAFASDIRSFDHFTGTVFLSRTAGTEKQWPSFAAVPKLNIQGLKSWLDATDIKLLSEPLFQFRKYRPPQDSLPMCT